MSKLSWYDLENSYVKDIKKTTKMSDRQLEKEVRRHMDGANASDRRKLYEMVYGKRT